VRRIGVLIPLDENDLEGKRRAKEGESVWLIVSTSCGPKLFAIYVSPSPLCPDRFRFCCIAASMSWSNLGTRGGRNHQTPKFFKHHVAEPSTACHNLCYLHRRIFGGSVVEAILIKYRAFLSYSHKDASWARWLHTRLERFHIDKDLVGRSTDVGSVPNTLRPIFRDREDFSGGNTLTNATIVALDQSAALIVLCSPAAANSNYVNEEVRLFKSRHPNRPLIPVVISGSPPENFPAALRYVVAADGTITDQPVAILAPDVRESGDGRSLAVAKIVAGLTNLPTDDIFRRAEKARRRNLRIWISGMTAVAITLAGLTVWAEINRRQAVDNLATAFAEKGVLSLEAKDALSGRVLLANSLQLRDSPTARKLLAENWHPSVTVGYSYGADSHISSVPSTEIIAPGSGICCKALAVAPDGKRIFLGRDDGKIDELDAITGLGRAQFHLGNSVSAIAVSPNGSFLAAGGKEQEIKRIKVWSLEHGELLEKLATNTSVLSLAFDPTAPRLGVGLAGGGVTQFNLLTEQPDWQVEGHGQSAQGLVYSPNGKSLYWSGSEEWLWATDALTGKSHKLLNRGKTWGYALSTDRAGERIAFHVDRSTIRIAGLATGESFDLIGHKSDIFSLDFSVDGRKLLSADAGGISKIWDLVERRLDITLPFQGAPIYAAKFLPKSNAVVLALNGNGASVYKVSRPSLSSFQAPQQPQLLASIERFKKENPGVTHPLEIGVNSGRITNRISALQFMTDGDLLVSTQNGPLLSLKAEFRTVSHELPLRPGMRGPRTFAFAPIRSIVAIAPKLGDPTVELWSLTSGEKIKELASPDNCAPYSFALNDTAEVTAVGCKSGSVLVIDTQRDETLRKLGTRSHGAAEVVAMDSDTGIIASGYGDGWIRIWDKGGIERFAVKAHDAPVETIAFQKGGHVFASASNDQRLKIWKLDKNGPTTQFSFWSHALAFSNDGRWLAAGGEDRLVHVINLKDNLEWATIPGHLSTITALQFSGNNGTLVSGDDSGAILFQDFKVFVNIFDANPHALLETAERESGLRTKGFVLHNVHSPNVLLQ
jgi:WD40 repeat protein